MSLTTAQSNAVKARGDVLVVAGAGTGKTRTLVERCLDCLLYERPRVGLDQILIVTFTEAAAAELRRRLRARLEAEVPPQSPDTHWEEQIALFDTAHIGTLHSFCLKLVREHFYELELDPQLSVLAEGEAKLLADETLRDILRKCYAGKDSFSENVRLLIQTQWRGWDEPLRRLVLRLHHYTQTLPDPAAWFCRQLAVFENSHPDTWQQWLLQATVDWRNRWRQRLQPYATPEQGTVAECWNALASLPDQPSRSQAAAVFQAIVAAKESCPSSNTSWPDGFEHFLQGTRFLLSLAQISRPPASVDSATGRVGAGDPLVEDWGWMRPQLLTLLRLAQNFTQAFSESKRELGVVDFHDLEQHALRLLWDSQANQPTLIAGAWRKQLRFVFVDEYQDINAAQDRIIAALSRQGAQANRFLVGDVKQSIYRFRLANPHIFQGYVEQWSCGRGKAIPLVDNFRSREALLHFVNGLFGSMMDRNCGGVDYQQGAQLRFGAALERNQLSVANSPAPCAELHLRLKPQAGRSGEEPSEAMADLIQLEEAAKEARVVALRLRELKSQNHQVWDETLHTFRPVDWRDMAILLRSPANKSESYAKEFSHLNVPLEVVRGGFYRSLEVSDLLSLLQVLDNPLQDLPLLALLHSPLVGLSVNELAIIRLPSVKTRFWTALTRWAQAQNTGPTIQSPELLRKICAFLDQYGRWRRLARQVSLSRCLEAVLAETHYADWLLTQSRGEQRHANVIRLLASAQEFDQFQRQGLFRFLRFIEAQQLAETEPQIPATSEQNAVRLMSIHQSKGLEFPVVVVADLGKPFNFVDIRAEIILDEKYGLCSLIKPPHSARRYPSLPYWLAQQRQAEEIVGEEMRLLYVAVTRSRDLLLLSGTMTETKFVRFQKQRQEPQAAGQGRLPAGARSYIDWIVPWFLQTLDAGEIGPEGQNTLLRWFIHDDKRLAGYEPLTPVADQTVECGFEIKPGLLQQLQQRLTWRYPWISSTRQPAKLSVSALRRRAAIEESDDAAPAPGRAHSRRRQRRSAGASKRRRKAAMSELHGSEWAAEKGAANHLFLQLVSLDHVDSLEQLNRESQRLQVAGALTPAEAQLLDLEAVAAFWCSSLGRRIGDKAQFVHRELAFTARFALTDLADIAPQLVQPDTEGEFVIVRGVADLVVLLPREIWVLDFKTDAVQPGDLTDKAEQYYPQLRLYARALAGIYRRPVTESWLYFLGPRQAIPTSNAPLLKHSSLQGEFPGL